MGWELCSAEARRLSSSAPLRPPEPRAPTTTMLSPVHLINMFLETATKIAGSDASLSQSHSLLAKRYVFMTVICCYGFSFSSYNSR